MRLTNQQARDIARLAHRMAGETARVRLFGSRLDDDAKGGDIDLLLEIPEPVTDPALVAARFAAQVTRLMRGRKVDVLLAAPNLKRLPIHEVALSEGRLL
jgi:predicted nucleotidyltransferase